MAKSPRGGISSPTSLRKMHKFRPPFYVAILAVLNQEEEVRRAGGLTKLGRMREKIERRGKEGKKKQDKDWPRAGSYIGPEGVGGEREKKEV